METISISLDLSKTPKWIVSIFFRKEEKYGSQIIMDWTYSHILGMGYPTSNDGRIDYYGYWLCSDVDKQ